MLYGRKNTKENRQAVRAAEFAALITAGYTQETYKELDFFTKDDQFFTLKVFRGTGANHVEFVNYRTAERRAEVIQNYKNNYERNLTWKAEQKEKNKGKSSSHAAASAAIKAELKAAFPHVKFSVKSDSYSGGDSVHISWTDGPTTAEVESISGKYQYGHFNGMEDLYEITNSRNDIPQVKYVQEQRSRSEEVNKLEDVIKNQFAGWITSDYGHGSANNILYRIWAKTSFPEGAQIIGIKTTEQTCGQIEDLLQIDFQLTETNNKEQTEAQPIETTQGEINIVDYSEKAFAVIGTPEDLKAIQAKMYELGGKWNKHLKCGPGYIFSKKQLETVTKALSEEEPELQSPEPTQNDEPQPAEPQETTLRDEVVKMVEWFAESDIKQCGEITESTKEIARVQNVNLFPVQDEAPQHYDNLQDITAAAKSGKVISLFNLSQLV